jgi:signal transduction histidine kinase/CheY-like chemotaxis protein
VLKRHTLEAAKVPSRCAWLAGCAVALLSTIACAQNAPDTFQSVSFPEAATQDVAAQQVTKYFRLDQFGIAQGLPQNSVTSMAFDADGFLWVGTFGGLARFNGSQFDAIELPAGRDIRVTALAMDQTGALWVGTEAGQLFVGNSGQGWGAKDWQFHALALCSGCSVHEITSQGAVVNVLTSLGLYQARVDMPPVPRAGVPLAHDTAHAMPHHPTLQKNPAIACADVRCATSSDGRLHSIGRRLVLSRASQALAEIPLTKDCQRSRRIRGHGGPRARREKFPVGSFAKANNFPVDSFASANKSGTYWLGSDSLCRVRIPLHPQTALGAPQVQELVHVDGEITDIAPIGAQEAYAIQINATLLHWQARKNGRHGLLKKHLLPASYRLRTLLVDRFGQIWLGTDGQGLVRLTPNTVRYAGASGREIVGPVLPVAFANVGGAGKVIDAGTLSPADRRTSVDAFIGPLCGDLRAGDGGVIALPIPPVEGKPCFYSLYADRVDVGAQLWLGLGSNQAIYALDLKSRKLRSFMLPVSKQQQAIRALYRDRFGTLLAGSDRGLLRLEKDHFIETPARSGAGVDRFSAGSGPPNDVIYAIGEWPDGTLWLGTSTGLWTRDQADRAAPARWSQRLALANVRAVLQDPQGGLLVGSYGSGLSYIAQPAVAAGAFSATLLTIADGLYENHASCLLLDAADRLWFSGNQGIYVLPRHALVTYVWEKAHAPPATAQPPKVAIESLHPLRLGVAQGMREAETNGGGQSSCAKAPNEQFWFSTIDGTVIIDPPSVQAATSAPAAFIRAARINDVHMQRQSSLTLAGGDSIEIAYDSIDLRASVPAHYRYRLVPSQAVKQAPWIDAGTAKRAFFPSLPYGALRFEVQTLADSGVAGPAAVLLLHNPRPIWAQWWFWLGITTLIAALTGWLVRRNSLTRQRQLEAAVANQTLRLSQQNALLQDVDALRVRFFTNVSHEFRTPLTLISGPISDVLEHSAELSPEVRQSLVTAQRNAEHMRTMLTELLDISRLEARQLPLRLELLDAGSLLQRVCEGLLPFAQRYGVQIHCNVPAAPLALRLDAQQIERALSNLISNACKYSTPGQQVVAELAATAGGATFSVQDFGCGIAAHALAQVFERFYRAEQSDLAGSGIGLSLVREIALAHGGHVQAHSELGRGSTFSLHLPAAQPATAALGVAAQIDTALDGAEPIDSRLDQPLILVVEDNAELCAHLVALLARHYAVLSAQNGQAGYELAVEKLPDLILSDVMMPVLDGLGLVAALRAEPQTQCIPILLLTARAGSSHAAAALNAGADDYLVKPFDAPELLARIQAQFARQQRLRRQWALQLGAAPVAPAPESSTVHLPMPEQDDPWLVELHAVVHAGLSSPSFDVSALADALAMDRRTLHRRLSQLCDCMPVVFLRRQRLLRAQALLDRDAGSIAEVAYAVGFESLSYFSKCFRAEFGALPSAYRRQG